jgi:hypothetical protein
MKFQLKKMTKVSVNKIYSTKILQLYSLLQILAIQKSKRIKLDNVKHDFYEVNNNNFLDIFSLI